MSVGSNIKHDSSYGHVTGTSIFVDDRSPLRGEIHVGVVGAPCAAEELKKFTIKRHLNCLEYLLSILPKTFLTIDGGRFQNSTFTR